MRISSAKQSSKPVEYVTAFYPGPNKHPDSSYRRWAQRLFQATRRTIIHLYVPSDQVASNFAALGVHSGVHFHVVRPEDLPARRLPVDWESQVRIDPERAIHRDSSHLYVVWNSKVGLAAQIAETADATTSVFWIDLGYVRNLRTHRVVSRFPSQQQVSLIQAGGLHFLAVEPFSEPEIEARSSALPDDFRGLVRIGGGMFGGVSEAWSRYSAAYGEAIAKWASSGQFVGKDQYAFAAICLRRPDLATAWKMTRRLGNPWFEFPRDIGRQQAMPDMT